MKNDIAKVASLSSDKYYENCGKNIRRKGFWTNTFFQMKECV